MSPFFQVPNQSSTSRTPSWRARASSASTPAKSKRPPSPAPPAPSRPGSPACCRDQLERAKGRLRLFGLVVAAGVARLPAQREKNGLPSTVKMRLMLISPYPPWSNWMAAATICSPASGSSIEVGPKVVHRRRAKRRTRWGHSRRGHWRSHDRGACGVRLLFDRQADSTKNSPGTETSAQSPRPKEWVWRDAGPRERGWSRPVAG